MPPPREEPPALPRSRNTVATNLPISRAAIAKPLVPRRFRHPSTRRRKAPDPEPPASDSLFSALSTLSDAALALETLRTAWPQEAVIKLPRTPPIALLSQLRALVADSNALDRELTLVVARNDWRRIVLPSREIAFICTRDVVAKMRDGGRLERFANEVLPAVRDAVLAVRRLREVFGEGSEAVECELVRGGWLTMRDESSFWFAVPGMGGFDAQRRKGAAELLDLLRKTPFKEMLLNKLEGRSMKKSCFTAQWHVRDLVGGGPLETIETSVGTLVRLR